MTYRWLTDLDQALAAAHVPFTPIMADPADYTGASSWANRGRPSSTGQFDPSGVLCHHTASPAGTSDRADLNAILWGNSEAPGPISQLYIGRTGTVYLVAAGRANHGGKGRRPGVDSACADMNAHLVGIEAGNNGVGEWWPGAQTDAYAAVVAALCDWYRWPIDHVYLHATTGPPGGGCNSKIDPAGPWEQEPDCSSTWNLEGWRAYCAAGLEPDEGNEMTDVDWERMTELVHAQVLDVVRSPEFRLIVKQNARTPSDVGALENATDGDMIEQRAHDAVLGVVRSDEFGLILDAHAGSG